MKIYATRIPNFASMTDAEIFKHLQNSGYFVRTQPKFQNFPEWIQILDLEYPYSSRGDRTCVKFRSASELKNNHILNYLCPGITGAATDYFFSNYPIMRPVEIISEDELVRYLASLPDTEFGEDFSNEEIVDDEYDTEDEDE